MILDSHFAIPTKFMNNMNEQNLHLLLIIHASGTVLFF